MVESKKCQECGTELPENAPEGLCPKCLMRVALGESRVGVTLSNPARIDGPGTTIGRYELLELIGEGGMGLVYLAEQKEPVRRKVALKIIKPGMDSRQVVARFEAERQTLALLDHPNVAHVFDAGCTETGRPYFVMEHVKGMPITRYCDENKLTIEQRLRLFEQVCEAVHHAHQKGIIHRDLKPSNILVSVHGDRPVPKIIDFGIAKAVTVPLTDKTAVTLQGQLLGTPEYMSPEQVDLAAQDIDTRSDIYSLGIILYELLAGVLPFEKDVFARAGLAEIQQAVRELEPAPPSFRLTCLGEKAHTIAARRGTQLVPLARRLHRELEWIPLKAMRKDRCRRYRSASEMADDVHNYLSGRPLLAGPETAVYRVQKFVRKHAGSVTAAALVALAIVLGFGTSTTMYAQAEGARQKETIAREAAEQAEEVAKDKADGLRRTLYVNSVQLADAKYREGNISRVRELLASCPNDLRGWEWNRLNYVQDDSLSSLHIRHDRLHRIVLSPDGKQVITTGSQDKTIRVWDASTGAELKTLRGHGGLVYVHAVSADGKLIASGDLEKTVKLWDGQSGAAILTLKGLQTYAWALAFSPDGKRLASGGSDGTITLWDTQTGTNQITLRGHRGEIYDLAFSPDGKRIASGSGDWTIKLWDAQTGAELRTLRGHGGWVKAVGFSPDGKRIVSGSWDKTIKVWDAETGVPVTTIRGHNGGVMSVVFRPDAKVIASGGRDHTIRVWTADGGDEIRTFYGHDGSVAQLAFTPDGKHLISAGMDGAVKVWDLMTDRSSVDFAWHDNAVDSLAFSPDGRQIVSGSLDCTVRLWDAQTGQAIRTMRGSHGPIHSVAFSPDSRRIASGDQEGNVVRVWDASTGVKLMVLRGHKGGVLSVAFSPNGKYIVSGSDDQAIKLWDATSGNEVATFEGHGACVTSVAFSPDGRRIASADDDGTAKIWDTATRGKLMTLRGHGHTIWSITFSPDGKRIVSAGIDRTVRIWDAETGGELMNLAHPDGVFSAAFSPDGKRVISGCIDGAARVWDAATGAELVTLHAEDMILAVAFSPDGKTIAAGTGGCYSLLWESAPPSGGYEPRKTAAIAAKVVGKLYGRGLSYHDVIGQLQVDTTIDLEVRRLALQVASSHKWQVAHELDKEIWDVVRYPDKDTETYKAALEKAERANRLEPNDPAFLNTLGAAQYRLGSYQDALKTLAKSVQMLSDAKEDPDPVNTAFTAMILHRIGRSDEAKAALDQLRELCKERPFVENSVGALLAEAAGLIEGKKP